MLPRLQFLRGEFAGGLASAIPGLAHALTLGLLAFAPLGPEHADIGIRAGFAAGIGTTPTSSTWYGAIGVGRATRSCCRYCAPVSRSTIAETTEQ